MSSTSTEISIVVPAYNEEELLPKLIKRLKEQFSSLEYDPEIILVDDGSSDGTWKVISDHSNGYVKGVRLSRNFGQQEAILAGLKESSGDAVVVMDADFQNPPTLIQDFIVRWEEGYDVVLGITENRESSLLRRLSATFFYYLFSALTTVNPPHHAADFSLLSREVVDKIVNIPERRKFFRGLRAWVGYKQTEVRYNKPKRLIGRSNYSFYDLFQLSLDGMISMSSVPLRFSVFIGLLLLGSAITINGLIVLETFLMHQFIPLVSSITVRWELFLWGLNFLVLGIIGEYIGRIYDEVRGRPSYIIRDRSGFNHSTSQNNTN